MDWFLSKPAQFLGRAAFFSLLLFITYGSLDSSGPDLDWFVGADKAIHLGAYASLYLVGWFAYPGRPLHWLLYVGLLAYGLVIELLQAQNGRSGELADLLANATGLGLGCLLLVFAHRQSRFFERYRAAHGAGKG